VGIIKTKFAQRKHHAFTYMILTSYTGIFTYIQSPLIKNSFSKTSKTAQLYLSSIFK